jgi:hypothetical protein
MSADRFAQAALASIARNRAIIVVPRRARALWYVHRLSPAVVERVCRSIDAEVTKRLVRAA